MNEPKLRFKADDGSQFPDWEEHNFGDLYKVCSGYAFKYENYCDSGVALVNGQAIQHGWIDDNNMNYLPETFLQQYKDFVLKENDIVLGLNRPITNGKLKIARVPKEYNNSLLYQRAGKIVCKKAVDDDFSYALLAREIFKFTIKEAAGSDQPFISTAKLNNWKIMVPSSEREQQKIAEFLSTIDTVIEKQKETVSAWEERKKGVIQKLFSQEVRFKADDGSQFSDWEEKSFSDVFENLNNSTFSRDCLNYEVGNVKYIHYGDILIKFGFAIDVQSQNVPYVNEDLDCEKYASLSDGDIVIADTAEDDTVGKAVEIMNTHCGKTISGLHTIACHPREKFASKYLGYFMNANIYHNQLRPYMQGIKVTSVSKTNIALTKISVPCLAEQQKIADCLSSVDEVIEKQKATLSTWEELKKGLLQQMFV